MPITAANLRPSSRAIQVGYVPLIDAAPLLLAEDLGLYGKYGVTVRLEQQPGWSSTRDMIVYGELDAAHAATGLPFQIQYGLGCAQRDCRSGFFFNAQGNSIILSHRLRDQGIESVEDIARRVRDGHSSQIFTFGIVSEFSSHHFLLRLWLGKAGLSLGPQIKMVVLPPSLMANVMAAGALDGFCVGEPWGTVAVARGVGHCAATSADLAPMHPEKMLLVTDTFANERPEEHTRLIAALSEACEFCEDEANFPEVARRITLRNRVDIPPQVVLASLSGRHLRVGRAARDGQRVQYFHRQETNRPDARKVNWIMQQCTQWGLLAGLDRKKLARPQDILREDIYEEAMRLRQESAAAVSV
jgi:ABC-type nitrate/sulfonate/bicarbonate transport system substrate-binding protein